jgi:hypothetical protein
MKLHEIEQEIRTIYPDISGVSSDGSINYTSKPTKKEKDAAEKRMAELLPLLGIPSYKDRRAAEYPHIGDQLDALMKWAAKQTEIELPAELKSIAEACMAVKAKYPKA